MDCHSNGYEEDGCAQSLNLLGLLLLFGGWDCCNFRWMCTEWVEHCLLHMPEFVIADDSPVIVLELRK